MSDLSKLSDDDLMRLYRAAPEPTPQAGAAPATDLSQVSDADLMKLHGSFTDAPSTSSLGALGRVKDVARSAESGVDAGIAGIVGLPHAAMKLADDYLLSPAAKTIVQATGYTPTSERPGGDTRRSISDGFPSQDAISRAMEAANGSAYKPQTTLGEVAHTVGEFAPNAMFGGGSALQRAAQVVVPALASEGAGRAAAAIAPEAEPYARFTGALLGGVGTAVAQAPRGGSVLMRDALEGIAPEEMAAAHALRETARSLPGGGIEIPLDEALNHVTGGRAMRLSQVSRVVANSGGEAGRIMGETYAARPGQIDRIGRATLDTVAPENAAPSGVGLDVQAAARAGVAQTPEGMALAEARAAAGPRVTPDQAGRVIQPEMRGVADAREAVRSLQADRDYGVARAAPETAGIERTVTVERPGEPLLQTLNPPAPRGPVYAPPPEGPDTIKSLLPTRPERAAGPEGPSLSRFIAENGGIGLERGDVAHAGLDRWRQPGVGSLVRQDGKSIDGFWRTKLIEKGYLPPDADGMMQRDIRGELVDLLQGEQRGRKVYPHDYADDVSARYGQMRDDHAAAANMAQTSLNKALGGAGLKAKDFHPEVVDRATAAMMKDPSLDPLDAIERSVMASREPASRGPTSRMIPTTVTEEIPDIRFGQVNPTPALAAIGEQVRTAKGDVRGALGNARRDLFEPGGEPDMSVAGLLHARERLDFQIRSAQDIGDATKVRDLTISRNALDAQLKGVPEVATADANFAANSRPLEPFAGNAPLGRVVQQDPRTGRMATPTEQVPTHLQGASAAREFLGNATPAARQAYEGHVATRILDAATDRRGTIDPDRLNQALREHVDVLTEMPEVYHRLDDVVRARDGLARVEKSPLGQLAQTDNVGQAINAIFPRAPQGANHQEIGAAMSAVARNNPAAARDLARIHLETAFNAATRDVKGLASQYGGAGFASGVRGNAQQAKNLEASIRALPNGDTVWGGLNRFLDVLETTGYKPQKGSDTHFNMEIGKKLADGSTPLANAITEATANAAAGGVAAGWGGAAGGGLLGLKKAGSAALLRRRIEANGEQLARMLTDPAALPDLRALIKSRDGTPNAQLFTTRLLTLANSGARSGQPEQRPVP